MAVNIFTYDPGGHLPFVETHIMEHGLIIFTGPRRLYAGQSMVSGEER